MGIEEIRKIKFLTTFGRHIPMEFLRKFPPSPPYLSIQFGGWHRNVDLDGTDDGRQEYFVDGTNNDENAKNW